MHGRQLVGMLRRANPWEEEEKVVGVVVDDDDGPEYPTSKYGVSRCVLVCKLLPP
jgi:hypothetical protein